MNSPLRSYRSASSILAAAVLACGLAAQQGSGSSLGEGFITGLRGFENLHNPVGQPIYFESAKNDTELRPIYLHHKISDGQAILQGGHADVFAVQARLALTERLGFIATKDGHSQLETTALGNHTGWNSLAAGLKYVWIADKEKAFLVTPGIRFEIENGSRDVLQGGVGEASPFLSFAKGYDQLHLMGNVTFRKPFSDAQGNQILQEDIHIDYDVSPEKMKGFAPCVELHGLSYLTNAEQNGGLGAGVPLNVGGLDYANIGAGNVKGSFVAWAGVGARYDIPDSKMSFGAVYEFALTNKDADLMESRVTVDFTLRF